MTVKQHAPKVVGRSRQPAARRSSPRPGGHDGDYKVGAPLHPAAVLGFLRSHGNAATTTLRAGRARMPTGITGTGWIAGAPTIQRQVKKPPPDGAQQAAALLKGVDPWAATEKKRQGVVDNAAVVGLDPKQAASIKNASAKLAAYIPAVKKAAQQLDPPLVSLKQAS